MRIAQIAPLYESVPPRLYGGTERIVSFLTEELVAMGHRVTLFASGDSRTRARLVSDCDRALRLRGDVRDPLAHHVAHLRGVMEHALEFDVIHNHMDYLGFLLAVTSPRPVVTTLHGRLDIPDLKAVFQAFPEVELISISDAQRAPLAASSFRATVPHGLPRNLLRAGDGRGGYLAFLGRMSPEKRPDAAIRIARKVGMPLRMAAKIDDADKEYFDAVIRPLLDTSSVEYVGEIGDADKQQFLGEAYALLMPIEWPEPFGIVMIEALACGTPVVARACGSVPEVVEDGVTGFLCGGEAEMVRAVAHVDEISRQRCRREFEGRFTSRHMADAYVRAYHDVLGDWGRGAA
ncbi:MAG TPA: glycosyltransferase family 4 protein [Candidatus Binatia bacterium]